MPTSQRHPNHETSLASCATAQASPRSQARRALAGSISLASILVAAALWVSAERASAMSFRGGWFGGYHAAMYRGSASRMPARTSRPTWMTSQRLGSRIAVSRPPYSGNGDKPLPHRPHRPIIGGIPGGPVGPIGPVNVSPTGPGGPPANAAGAPPSSVTANAQSFVPDEILVSFAANPSQQTIVNFAQGQRLALLGIHRLPLINTVLYRFRITDQRQVPAVVGTLQGDRRIAAVQPNFLYRLQDDAAQNTSIGASIGDPAQYVVSKMHLPEAHGFATGSHVLVAVIDSAIDAMHPALQGVVAGGFDTIKGLPLPHKHGTAMASAIAAHGRMLGVAPGAHILAVHAFDMSAAGAQATTARLLDGLQWTSTSGARVVNMSFTGPADPKIHEMIVANRRQGLVLVAAAGNNGPQAPEAYPAAYPEVIAVTATDVDDKVFSGANHGRYVAVAAPGVDIFVATPNGGFDFTTGTSVATAHVSGLAALLIERNPRLTPDAVQAILVRTAKDLGPKGRDDEYGAGLVDAYEALLTQAPATAERTLAH